MKKQEAQAHSTCSNCGAEIYPEHLDSGIARYEGDKLLCSFCVSDYEKKHDLGASGDHPLETIALQDDDDDMSPAASGKTRIHGISSGMFGAQHAWDDGRFKRSADPKGLGATRCRTFHSKLNDGSIEYMTNLINEWLDGNPNITVKFATTTIGPFEGKHVEQNLIITLFY